MKHRIVLFSVFLLSYLLLAGCDKHNDAKVTKEIIGKWKLSSVDYMVFVYGKPPVDYPKTAIYDFQKNGQLIITYVISGELQKSEHSYECKKMNNNPLGDDILGEGVLLQIDEERFQCVLVPKYKSLSAELTIVGCGYNKAKTLDDVDLVMMENENIYYWDKYFTKIN